MKGMDKKSWAKLLVKCFCISLIITGTITTLYLGNEAFNREVRYVTTTAPNPNSSGSIFYSDYSYNRSENDLSELSPVLNLMPKVLSETVERIVVPDIWIFGRDTMGFVYTNDKNNDTIYVQKQEYITMDFLIIHETAHLFAFRNGFDDTEEWLSIYEKEWNCSPDEEYGCTNAKEAYAESMVSAILFPYQYRLADRPLSYQYVLKTLGVLSTPYQK